MTARPEALPGGFVHTVTRQGDVVRRPAAPPFVHDLLRHLAGWRGAPRLLAVEAGQETLSFLPGEVPWRVPTSSGVHAPAALRSVGRLVRELHDLTAGTGLAADAEVVCHNDLSPKNTVYRDGVPIALLDWDLAAPGRRIDDVAHACWQFAGFAAGADAVTVAGRARRLCDGYGLAERDDLVATVLWWQDRCWRGIDARAASGDAAMIALRASGAVEAVRAAYDWTTRHASVLADAVV